MVENNTLKNLELAVLKLLCESFNLALPPGVDHRKKTSYVDRWKLNLYISNRARINLLRRVTKFGVHSSCRVPNTIDTGRCALEFGEC